MAKETPTEETSGPTTDREALDESLWQSLNVFVKKCGGDILKVSADERQALHDELEAWAVLVFAVESDE